MNSVLLNLFFSQENMQKISNMDQSQILNLFQQIQKLQAIELQKKMLRAQQENMKKQLKFFVKPAESLKPKRPKVPTFDFNDECWNVQQNSQVIPITEDSSSTSCQFEQYDLENVSDPSLIKESSETMNLEKPKIEKPQLSRKNMKKYDTIIEKLDKIFYQNPEFNVDNLQHHCIELVIKIINQEEQLKHKNMDILAGAIIAIASKQQKHSLNIKNFQISRLIECRTRTLSKMIEEIKYILN